MTTQAERTGIDIRGILTAVVASALVSAASFLWFMGGMETRVNVLERDSNKMDQVLQKVNDMSERMAIMNTDLAYVKQNMAELKLNSSSLSDDVRTLRITVSDLQQKGNNNGRQ